MPTIVQFALIDVFP